MALEKGIKRDFRKAVSDTIELEPDGPDRFTVITPLTYDDGDLLPITLKKEGGEWWLSDEGHSLMHLSYAVDEADLKRGTRKEIIERTLAAFDMESREGELRLRIDGLGYGEALYGFVHALLRVDDIRLLSRDRVRSTFMGDVRHFVETKIPESRRVHQWHEPARDPNAKYPVDYRINGRREPIYLFALPTTNQVNIATISLLKLKEWGYQGKPVAIFEDESKIDPKALARFGDEGPRTYSDLATARELLPREFPDIVEG